MTRRAYSSIAAFIAHWRALERTSARLSPDESQLLAAIQKLVSVLSPDEHEILLAAPNHSAGAEARRRGRVDRKIRCILLAAGWLQD